MFPLLLLTFPIHCYYIHFMWMYLGIFYGISEQNSDSNKVSQNSSQSLGLEHWTSKNIWSEKYLIGGISGANLLKSIMLESWVCWSHQSSWVHSWFNIIPENLKVDLSFLLFMKMNDWHMHGIFHGHMAVFIEMLTLIANHLIIYFNTVYYWCFVLNLM